MLGFSEKIKKSNFHYHRLSSAFYHARIAVLNNIFQNTLILVSQSTFVLAVATALASADRWLDGWGE
jgi:hypothetical protein